MPPGAGGGCPRRASPKETSGAGSWRGRAERCCSLGGVFLRVCGDAADSGGGCRSHACCLFSFRGTLSGPLSHRPPVAERPPVSAHTPRLPCLAISLRLGAAFVPPEPGFYTLKNETCRTKTVNFLPPYPPGASARPGISLHRIYG